MLPNKVCYNGPQDDSHLAILSPNKGLTGITERDIFVYAFRLGARFAWAVAVEEANRGNS